MKLRGFTLIELLVVIAIIGVLATFAVVQFSGARDKARLAKGSDFSASLSRTIGAYAVGKYDLEEGSGGAGTVIRDTSGENNNGSIATANTSWTTDTFDEKASSYALTFSASDRILLSRGSGISNANFTIAHWVKTTTGGGQAYTVLNAPGGNGFRFGIGGGRISFLIGNGIGYTETQCGTKTVNDGAWHHLAGVFDRTRATFTCYIDGSRIASVAIQAYPGMSDAAVSIGGGIFADFSGQMDDVRIYASNLDGISIKNIYNEKRMAFTGK